eukprot:GHVR01139304.1.p1 GENE.GHVR01139304.1~~GHVR01139304.1.p1  ORF type:complete len:125 (+),score=60.85 GHVR01139304.1:234-608(+)
MIRKMSEPPLSSQLVCGLGFTTSECLRLYLIDFHVHTHTHTNEVIDENLLYGCCRVCASVGVVTTHETADHSDFVSCNSRAVVVVCVREQDNIDVILDNYIYDNNINTYRSGNTHTHTHTHIIT